MNLTLHIPGKPEPQPRPRAARIGKHVRIYSPTCPEHRALIRQIASEQFGKRPPLAEPVRVDCVFVFPRPKGMIWKNKPMPRVPHTKKPDRDNLDKAVLDALEGVVFANDCQAWCGSIVKEIAAGDEAPHTKIVISTEDAE